MFILYSNSITEIRDALLDSSSLHFPQLWSLERGPLQFSAILYHEELGINHARVNAQQNLTILCVQHCCPALLPFLVSYVGDCFVLVAILRVFLDRHLSDPQAGSLSTGILPGPRNSGARRIWKHDFAPIDPQPFNGVVGCLSNRSWPHLSLHTFRVCTTYHELST